MKKSLLALAVLGAFATAASAQSNVTISGYLDLGVTKQDVNGLGSGQGATVKKGAGNYIAFSGVEDMGNGWSTTFRLSSGLNLDTGTVETGQTSTGTFWQKEATIGLKSASVGAFRLGRALTPMEADNWAYEPWWASGYNASLNYYQTGEYYSTDDSQGPADVAKNYVDYSRVNNALFYNSPVWAGFAFNVSYEIEKAAPTINDANPEHAVGIDFHYDNGPFSALLTWDKNHTDDKNTELLASYKFGAFTLMGSVAKSDYSQATQTFNGIEEKETMVVLAGTYDIGGGTIRMGYGHTKENGGSHRFSVGYNYYLSKRTAVYADLWHGVNEFNYGTVNHSSNAVALGIDHSF